MVPIVLFELLKLHTLREQSLRLNPQSIQLFLPQPVNGGEDTGDDAVLLDRGGELVHHAVAAESEAHFICEDDLAPQSEGGGGNLLCMNPARLFPKGSHGRDEHRQKHAQYR